MAFACHSRGSRLIDSRLTETGPPAHPAPLKTFSKNETDHVIERPGTEQSIKAKTAWNADTLRGDYADLLILDEWQLMDETAWEDVGAPMLLDNNGDAVFVYTPPSIRSQVLSRARDPRHGAKMFKKAAADHDLATAERRQSRWEAFHFTSKDNPHISKEALQEISGDMTILSYGHYNDKWQWRGEVSAARH